MDSRIINAKALEYGDRVLRITPAIIAQLGLIKRGMHLKIEDFFISSIPFDLSLVSASLLAFLSQSEVEFFQNFAGKPHKLNLSFKIPSSSKPASFFVLSEVLAFRKPDPASPYCFIDLKFRETPFVLKEILVEYFVDIDESEAFFKEGADEELALERIGLIFDHPHLSIIKDNVVAERLRITALSKRRVRLFGEYDGPPPTIGERLELEGQTEDDPCTIGATCSEFLQPPDLPGFAHIAFDLDFSPFLASRLRKAIRSPRARA